MDNPRTQGQGRTIVLTQWLSRTGHSRRSVGTYRAPHDPRHAGAQSGGLKTNAKKEKADRLASPGVSACVMWSARDDLDGFGVVYRAFLWYLGARQRVGGTKLAVERSPWTRSRARRKTAYLSRSTATARANRPQQTVLPRLEGNRSGRESLNAPPGGRACAIGHPLRLSSTSHLWKPCQRMGGAAVHVRYCSGCFAAAAAAHGRSMVPVRAHWSPVAHPPDQCDARAFAYPSAASLRGPSPFRVWHGALWSRRSSSAARW